MRKEHWQDWITALVALWLIVSPWVLGAAETDAVAAWNFWIVGLVLIALAGSELSAFRPWKEWAIAGAGTWLFLAPRVFSFPNAALTWNAVACGLAAVALAGWAIGDAHEILPKLVRPKNDLRGDSLGISVPDEHEHMAGAYEHRPDSGPGIVRPGAGTQSPGQTSHE